MDIWSAGVILFAMLCGYLPFEDPCTVNLYKKILNAEYNIPAHVSSEAASLLEKILVVDPAERLTVKQIRQHAWFRLVPLSKQEKLATLSVLQGIHTLPVNSKVLEILEISYDFDKEQVK